MNTLALLGHSALVTVAVTLVAAGCLRLLFRAAPAEVDAGRKRSLGLWSHRLHFSAWLITTGAMLLLIGLFLSDAFAFTYVAGRSNRAMASFYKVTALWAGQEGSLLLWLWIQSGYGLIVSDRALRGRPLDQCAAGVLALIASFFAILVAFVVDPFALSLPAPADGAGMNSILQSYWMTIHPVMLYLGYVGLSVPFAYAAASLMASDDGWVRTTRRWTLVAWTFLSVGILFGARWAYEELGWGGYWGWDPVENASFMPWLVATAFVHSALIQEKRGMLKRWNHGLVFCTYLLTIFGTFITRSGILSSVHAFVESDISPWFIAFMGVLSSAFLYGVLFRWAELQDDRQIESPVSKESSFLANNVVFLATTFAIFWGTVFPLVASAFGRQVTVGTPYFDRVTGPLFWALIVLMGVGPLIAWRRASLRQVKRHFIGPVLNAFFMAVWLWVMGLRETVILLTMPAVIFVLTTLVMEFARGAGARSRSRGEPLWLALPRMMNRNPGRYGGYVVHMGILFIVVGIAFSHVYQLEENVVLAVGEEVSLGPYRLALHGINETEHGGVPAVESTLLVKDGGGPVGFLQPSKRFYPSADPDLGPTTETAIYGTLRGDLYAVLAGWEPFGSLVGFKLFFNPLIWLIWAGGALLVFGGVFSLWPRAKAALSESERALASLAELEYDHQMGKVAEAEYRALFAELSPKAMEYLDAEAEASRHVLAELRGRLRGDVGADKTPGLGIFILAIGLSALSGFGLFQGVVGAQESPVEVDGSPNAAGPMGPGPAVPRETLVLRLQDGRLHVLNLITVTNTRREAAPEVRLPLMTGATAVATVPETLEPGEGAAVDTRPLAEAEVRQYTLQYQVPVFRWPFGFQRPIIYPTRRLQVLVPRGELSASGVDVSPAGTQTVAGSRLDVQESEWLAPGLTWQVILTPGADAGSVDGWSRENQRLPVLGEADRFPGDWLFQEPARTPALSVGGLLLIGLIFGIVRLRSRRMGKSHVSHLRPDAPHSALTGASHGDSHEESPGALPGESMQALVRSIARLDLAFAEGALAEGVYHRRRKGLMNRLVVEAEALGARVGEVLTELAAAEERTRVSQSAGRG